MGAMELGLRSQRRLVDGALVALLVLCFVDFFGLVGFRLFPTLSLFV